MYKLDFADDTFDLVYAHTVLTWLNDPLAAVREMMRVTKPGGVVAGQDPDFGAMFFFPPAPALEKWLRLWFWARTQLGTWRRTWLGAALSHRVWAALAAPRIRRGQWP